MREIKFRAWDKKAKSMLGEVGVSREGYCAVSSDKDRFTLMQYTGLKDKNGKEVWEGDINVNDKNEKSEVVFYAGGFYLKRSSVDYLCIGKTAPFNRNIIGNIYENPELLK